MSELVARNGTDLMIAAEQHTFTPAQVSALEHMGVKGASSGDLGVFFHVSKRTGLDPFARQIHMIGRRTFDHDANAYVTKWTIQTGIDGYRLIGRRAADRARETLSVDAPQWAHPDGSWRPVWSPSWGHPLGARVTVFRNGLPFTAVALFDEYKQTKRDGSLTQMWAQRPAGQIAKCAEALAWRMAFPQDLSGIYTDEEMEQADSPEPEVAASGSGRDRLKAALGQPKPAPVVPEPVEPVDSVVDDVVDAEVVEEDRNWSAEIDAAATKEELRSLWREVGASGLDEPTIADLTERITERVSQLDAA